jgi:hypothetical protein
MSLEPLLAPRAGNDKDWVIKSSQARLHAVTLTALLSQQFDENGLLVPLQVKPSSAIETRFLTNAPLKSWH